MAEVADQLRLRLDVGQATAALAILDKVAEVAAVQDTDWDQLFATAAYVQLKRREASVGLAFSDAAFKTFLLSPETVGRRLALRSTLMAWEALPLETIASQALDYLPATAQIAATIFFVIKPRPNSFVYGTSDDAMVFISLDPAMQPRQIEALTVHELHHIGLFAFECEDDARQTLPAPVRQAIGWMRNFREGYAMLAAAGGPQAHPHQFDGPAERREWDRAMTHFEDDLNTIDAFLLDVVHGWLTPEEAQRRAGEFLGRQGPWYTVGWRMAATVEDYFGRSLLIDTMLDSRLLLLSYNSAAVHTRDEPAAVPLPIWSLDLMRVLVPGTEGTAP